MTRNKKRGLNRKKLITKKSTSSVVFRMKWTLKDACSKRRESRRKSISKECLLRMKNIKQKH